MRLYDGDTFEHRGRTFQVRFRDDDSMREPWTEHDGHGVVSDWTTRAKGPGERVLCEDHGHKRYYNVGASLLVARKQQWGPVHCTICGQQAGPLHPEGHAYIPESVKQTAARAVEQDFEHLRRWCAGQWQWIGVVVTLLDGDDEPTEIGESLWGIESDADDYLSIVAHELADQIMTRVEVDEPEAVRSNN